MCWCNFELSKYWVVPFSTRDTCIFYQVTDFPALGWPFLSSRPFLLSWVTQLSLILLQILTYLSAATLGEQYLYIPVLIWTLSVSFDSFIMVRLGTLVIGGHCSFCLLISSLHDTFIFDGSFSFLKSFCETIRRQKHRF